MKKYNGLECVLLVDDDATTNFLNQQIIKKSAIDVSIKITSSSLEALGFLKENNTSVSDRYNPYSGLILLDINMPGMNGWEFLKRFKKLSRKKINIKKAVIIMLSSSINTTDIKMAEQDSEVKEFISKPLKIEDVKKVVEKYFSA